MSTIAGKKDLVEMYAKENALSKAEAEKQVNSVLACMHDCFVNGGLSIKGMFTATKKVQKGRDGAVNGVEYHTEDKNTLKFKVGSALEEDLNK